jgi:hypothetical protein
MTARMDRRFAAGLLILVPVAFSVCFTLLQSWFEYPGILRQPTADILTKFQAGGDSLVAVWYVLTIAALLFIPIAALLYRTLAEREAPALLQVATAFGIVAGLTQTLGFLRWPFLMPHLAQVYLAPESSEAQRAATAAVFEAFHRYAGMGVGEHLGYLCTSVWTVGVALVMWRSSQFGRALGLSGVVLGVGIGFGLVEPAGWELAGTINAFSYLAWAVWLVAVGLRILLRRDVVAQHASAPLTAPASLA